MMPPPQCWTRWTQHSPSLPRRDRRGGIIMGGGEATGLSMKRMRIRMSRGIFRALLCEARGPVMPLLTRGDAVSCGGCLLPARDPSATHRWELPVLHYHEIMVIYNYPFFEVITQLFSWIICINDCICIWTVSPG